MNEEEKNNTVNNDKKITYEGELYKLSKKNKLKFIYVVLIEKDLYYYSSSQKDNLLKMQNLSACFIKETFEKKLSNENYFCSKHKPPNS